MEILLTIHSILRWVIVIVAILAVVKFAIGWASNRPFQGMDRGLTAGLSGLIDLQVLLGLIFFLWNGFAGAGFPRERWEHMVTMIVAAVVAHLPSRWKTLADKRRFLNSMLAILGALALIYAGVVVLPGGWSR